LIAAEEEEWERKRSKKDDDNNEPAPNKAQAASNFEEYRAKQTAVGIS
jgi:hypothetical protein